MKHFILIALLAATTVFAQSDVEKKERAEFDKWRAELCTHMGEMMELSKKMDRTFRRSDKTLVALEAAAKMARVQRDLPYLGAAVRVPADNRRASKLARSYADKYGTMIDGMLFLELGVVDYKGTLGLNTRKFITLMFNASTETAKATKATVTLKDAFGDPVAAGTGKFARTRPGAVQMIELALTAKASHVHSAVDSTLTVEHKTIWKTK